MQDNGAALCPTAVTLVTQSLRRSDSELSPCLNVDEISSVRCGGEDTREGRPTGAVVRRTV